MSNVRPDPFSCWLEQAGFAIDTPVSVRVMEGCLVLIAAGDKAG
ncbi:SymE family type I addiction module toxin [Gilvimarinus sp. SDUM040013]|uniref:SymE family type I addiction module toxin n=1 Tax=Gilvimarinus gilvus TaxID=3058038 RepID=A0ABU4S2Y8_9GAMM|nr:SymE family type I addiction module toxin [Gilvimarinus sp. SDUM040013]MDO3384916.1 SymE family type I addiction module toxin [Gilvimarinus sp. SDUM040013]MDX6851299.1 SymE family type I addiction module toxin [Gilvimarinus sp. SDUM040013]